MKYKFISKEQTKKDWEEGRVQCEYNGDLKKLIQLINIVSKECGAKGTDKYYFINKYKNWHSSKFPFENLPTATTDELYEWIYGEDKEQRELLGYRLNGKRTEEQLADFLNTFPSAVRELSIKEDNKLIQLASELGVLSTCFEPVYKDREVVIKLSDCMAVVNKDTASYGMTTILITDLKKILEAHKEL